MIPTRALGVQNSGPYVKNKTKRGGAMSIIKVQQQGARRAQRVAVRVVA